MIAIDSRIDAGEAEVSLYMCLLRELCGHSMVSSTSHVLVSVVLGPFLVVSHLEVHVTTSIMLHRRSQRDLTPRPGVANLEQN